MEHSQYEGTRYLKQAREPKKSYKYLFSKQFHFLAYNYIPFAASSAISSRFIQLILRSRVKGPAKLYMVSMIKLNCLCLKGNTNYHKDAP